MTTATLALTEFLLARIAEDETTAQAAARAAGHRWSPDPIPGRDAAPAIDRHYATFDPARVLAECEAKRRIVDDAMSAQHSLDSRRDAAPDAVHGHVLARRRVMRQLAAVYADHPDYRQEWRL